MKGIAYQNSDSSSFLRMSRPIIVRPYSKSYRPFEQSGTTPARIASLQADIRETAPSFRPFSTATRVCHQHSMPSVVWDILEPGLQKFRLYTPPDPTYGRYLTKPWAPEHALDDDPTIKTRRRRVFLHGRADPDSVDIEFAEDIRLVPEELSKERIREGRWVYYKSWEMKEESLASKEGLGVDILLVHGKQRSRLFDPILYRHPLIVDGSTGLWQVSTNTGLFSELRQFGLGDSFDHPPTVLGTLPIAVISWRGASG